MTTPEAALLVLLVAVAAVAVFRFERTCLSDLARTPDERLRHFTRQGWIALIILGIPFGGILYLRAGKWQ